MKATKLIQRIMGVFVAAMIFTACEKGVHDNEYPLGDGEAAVFVGMESSKPVSCLSVFVFDDDGAQTQRKDYTDPRIPARECLTVAAGSHTIVVVANVAAGNLLETGTKTDSDTEKSSLNDLSIWLKEHEADYAEMMTASIQETSATGDVERICLTLKEGANGINITDVKLRLSLPGQIMPAYTARSGANPSLRLVTEVFKKGTETCLLRRSQLCIQQPDNTFEASLMVMPGEYDLRLWTDWSHDGTTCDSYYNTNNLNAVILHTEDYMAGEETEGKDAYYATTMANVGEEDMQMDITMIRPFARYRLVATDVKEYLNLIEKGENLTPIEDLEVRVCYEGFFPSAFSVVTGKPNDALAGICYISGMADAEGYDRNEARQIGGDFVLTSDEESFVSVTVIMIDKRNGNEVNSVSGVKIPYRRGELTTVTGNFLTAGYSSGSVEIDTDWGEDIVIEF